MVATAIWSFNAAKGIANNDAALEAAASAGCAVLHIQEPYISTDGALRLHPQFDAFLPLGNDNPKTVTYTRKSLGFHQTRAGPTIVAVSAGTLSTGNCYWLPSHKDSGTADLLGLPRLTAEVVVTGDFNSSHPSWEDSAPASPEGNTLAWWTARRGLRALVRRTSTHSRGHTLDLAFSNCEGASAAVRRDLGFKSDHWPVAVNVPHTALDRRPPRRRVPLHRFHEYLQATRRLASLLCYPGGHPAGLG